MSYQDFLDSTQAATVRSADNPAERTTSPPASPPHVIHRKPANYSPIPLNASTGSVYKHVTQYNSMRSTSVSSQGQGQTIVPTSSMSKRSFSPLATASPISATRTTTDLLPAQVAPLVPAPAPAPADIPSIFSTTNGADDYPPPPAHAEWHAAIKSCLALQNDAVYNHNKRPFAALLLGPDKATTLCSHFSISHVQHAESELARLASLQYSMDYLKKCTLVSTWEPCAMCAGTIYWSGIGRVVYAASESKLRELTGPGNSENMTMDLPCRIVFGAGQTKVDVVGPVPGWEEKVVEESRRWWHEHNFHGMNGHDSRGISGSTSMKSSSIRSYRVVTNPPPAEGVFSRIDQDGEYKADLAVDWMS